MSGIEIKEANFSLPEHGRLLVELLDSYAREPEGGGEGLSDYAKENLAGELRKRSGALTLFAFIDGEPAGLVNCLEGFSTFACRPLLNIHDIVVLPEFRRRGAATLLLKYAEDYARNAGFCKLTLEVLEGNDTARQAYEKFGFREYTLDPRLGRALFWEKKL